MDKPSSSKRTQANTVQPPVASAKGKDQVFSAPASDTASVSSEAKPKVDDVLETADLILQRQVALTVSPPPSTPLVKKVTPHCPLVALLAPNAPPNASAPKVYHHAATTSPPKSVAPMAATQPPATTLQGGASGKLASSPPPKPGPSQAPRPQATLATKAPATTVVDKSLWIYVSNVRLTHGRRGWTEAGTDWSTQLVHEMGGANLKSDLRTFTRVRPAIHDPRLVLEAPSPYDRRALYLAIKASHTHVRSHLHLTP